MGLERAAGPLMAALPRSARLFVGAVIAAGLAVLVACLPYADFDELPLFFALLVLSCATAALKVELPLIKSSSTMSVSYAIDLAALLLIGPHETMLVAAASTVSQCHLLTRKPTPLYRTVFSVAVLVLAVQGAGLAMRALGAGEAGLSGLAEPLAAAAAVYFIVNTGLVTIAIALSTGEPVVRTWRDNFLWSAASFFVGAGAAAVGVWIVALAGYWMVPLTFAPVYLTYRTYRVYMGRIEDERRHVKQTSDLHLATIEALARAIDAKDQPTQSHIRRVQVYAAGLAKAAGLSDDEIQGVKTAALLHDIGKLAVPEHILSKPGPLTQEEFQKIRIHPQVGAEIIAGVPFPYPVAPLILSHHERWDGKGYPQGLAGDAIPIGARILTIVDYYDAVTTERPYHRALSADSAVAMLMHESGRALDPRLVDTFLDLLPSLTAEYASSEPVEAPAGAPAAPRSAADAAAARRGNAFENIALAHREIYALYEIAQAMGTSLGVSDTMALISSKLTKLVPWSGCALFLHDPVTDRLRCRFAAGVDAPRLLNASVDGNTFFDRRAARPPTLLNVDPGAAFLAAGIAKSTALSTALVCPLSVDDTFLGALALYHTTPQYFSEDHRRVLEQVADHAGTVINNSIVFEQTQEDSLTDPLTGLPNRRSLFAHISRELARAGRLKSEVALVVMDLDRFKTINDSYGHNVGDAALRAVAGAVHQTLRPYDLCVRYAGDEFIVVLSDCSRESAELKRRELQDSVASLELEVRPGRTARLAISAGVAVFPYDGQTYEELLAEADQRMYRDKAAKRGDLPPGRPHPAAEFVPLELFDTARSGPLPVPLTKVS